MHRDHLEQWVLKNQYDLAYDWIEQDTERHKEYMQYLEDEFKSRYGDDLDRALEKAKDERIGL